MALTFRLERGRVERLDDSETLQVASSLLPQGAYTSLRTYGASGVLRLRQHVARLNETAALVGTTDATVSEPAARELLRAALGACAFPQSRVRLTWAPPALYASLEPFLPLPEDFYRDGVRSVSVPVRRENPHAKDTRFIATASAAYRSLPEGVHEGLLLADDGAILEGLSSNFFAVKDGRLQTEELRALLGVTRSLVLEVASGLLPIEPAAVLRSDLLALSDAFITSVSRGILPVVEIDGQRIGSGQPGAATQRLRRAFAELESREVEPV